MDEQQQTTLNNQTKTRPVGVLNILLTIVSIICLCVIAFNIYSNGPKKEIEKYPYCLQFTDGRDVIDRLNIPVFCTNQSTGKLFCGWSIQNESKLILYDYSNTSKIFITLDCFRYVDTNFLNIQKPLTIDNVTKLN